MKLMYSLTAIIMLVSCYSKTHNTTGFENKPLPNFKLLLLDSISYLNSENIPTGKPFIVVYVGTHCPYSKAQVEEMVENIAELEKSHIYIITADAFTDMENFAKQYQLHRYKNIVVGVDQKDAFGNYYKIAGIPFTAFYGRDKLLQKAFSGRLSSELIKKELLNK